MSANNVFTIVLGAGEARRFGSTKQLAEIDGLSLIARAMRAAEAVSGARSVLVTGNDWQAVAAAAEPLTGFMVVNPEYAEGLSTSIGAGIRSVQDVADAVLLVLADQPLVTVEHLAALIATWRKKPESIVATGYDDTSGPPVLFPRRFFAALASLSGDRGARSVIDSNPERLEVVRFEPAGFDIDRPEDLARI
jgi:molybdenum cofactor cytidylyltransferase